MTISSSLLRKQIIFLLLFLSFGQLIQAQENKKSIVYKFDIKEEIAPPVWRTTKNAFEQAKLSKADYILIHMNTYGGLLDAADSIRTKILQSKIPVFVFIDNNAASAGALISIACDSIYMRKGANIGAATVVDQTGKPLPDKYQSYMRSMMRSTAESKGRDPNIAQAMVDPKIIVKNVSDSGNVLTFTTSEAIINGYCEGEAETIYKVLELAGVNDYEIKEHKLSAVDKLIGLLIKPYISGILIMLIIGGIYFELQSPGLGFPSAAAIIGAMLYFAPLYLEGLAENWEIILFFIGVILIAVEIFAIPGFGIAGISGIFLVITGLTLSMVGKINFEGDFSGMAALMKALLTVVTAVFVSLVGSIWLSKTLFTSNVFGHLALQSVQNVEDGYTSSDNNYKSMLGEIGIAQTVLRPAGKVLINDKHFDATALNGFIDKGDEIKVVKYETAQLFVTKTN